MLCVIFVLLLPIFICSLLTVTMPAGPYEMDHGHGNHPGTFYPLMQLYHQFFYILAGLSTFGAMEAWKHNANTAAVVFIIAAMYGLLFNGFLLLSYEKYMHQRYPMVAGMQGSSNYGLLRYAAVLSLSMSTVLAFIVGIALTIKTVGQ